MSYKDSFRTHERLSKGGFYIKINDNATRQVGSVLRKEKFAKYPRSGVEEESSRTKMIIDRSQLKMNGEEARTKRSRKIDRSRTGLVHRRSFRSREHDRREYHLPLKSRGELERLLSKVNCRKTRFLNMSPSKGVIHMSAFF